VRLLVEDVFRGKVGREVFDVQGGGADCLTVYEEGKRYLLYADGYDPTTGRVLVPGCGGGSRIDPGDKELEIIRGLPHQPPQQTIHGRVLDDGYEPLRGASVVAESAGKKYRAVTDKDGDYQISLRAPGTYKVRVTAPFSAVAMNYDPEDMVKDTPGEGQTILEYEVNVPKGECRYKEMRLFRYDPKAVAEIRGRVIDAEGKPCPSLTLYLYKATDERDLYKHEGSYAFARTDAEGNYAFEGLRGGRFWLGVNIGRLPDADDPYPTTFYPGVPEIELAQIVELKDAQKLKLGDLRLRPRLIEREITGVLLWPDGSPVNKLSPDAVPGVRPILSLYDPRRLGMSLDFPERIDDEGRFYITAFEGYTYVLNASAFNAEDKPMRSKYVKLTVTHDMQPLRLVLDIPRGTRDDEQIRREMNEPTQTPAAAPKSGEAKP